MNKKLFKQIGLSLIITTGLIAPVSAADVWVSDEIEAPLRDKPELNANIVSMLPAGQRVVVVEKNKDYVKIKTSEGAVGWLSNYYVLNDVSVHEQLAPLKRSLADKEATVKRLRDELQQVRGKMGQLESSKSALEKTINDATSQAKSSAGSAQKFAADNKLLQTKLSQQSAKMEQLAKALDIARQKSTTANARYAALVKVSGNVAEIERQNRMLQEKVVQDEQDLQKLKNENQSMKARLNTRQAMMTALMIFGGILAGYILSILTPPRGRRPSSGSFY